MKKVILYHVRKHPSLATVLLATSTILFMGICSYVMLRPIMRGAEQAQTIALSPHELAMQNSSVAYPQFEAAKATEIVKQYATKQADEFVATLGGSYDPRNRFVLDYALLHQGGRTASIQFLEQQQRVDQPTILSHHLITVDLAVQKEVTFASLFKPEVNASEQLGFLLYDYFKQQHVAEFTPAQSFSLLQFKTEMARDFWIGDQVVGFSFNPQQPNSGDGLKKITIHKSVIADLLKSEYAANDPGKGMDQSADYAISTRPRPGDAIDPGQKMLALTFDDGPGRHTSRVLDTLDKYRARGTFFVLGQQVTGRADVVKRMANEGHEIGNHSWDHALLPPLSPERVQQEVLDTQNAIRTATGGYTPVLMRPPYGASSPALAACLHAQGLTLALWNVDPEDWLHKGDANAVYSAVMGSAHDGGIVLLHDIHEGSVEAIERAVPELMSQGYQLVTMSQLERYR